MKESMEEQMVPQFFMKGKYFTDTRPRGKILAYGQQYNHRFIQHLIGVVELSLFIIESEYFFLTMESLDKNP